MERGGGVDGLALGSIAAGGLFLFAAIKGKSVLGSVQSLIKGQSPARAPVTSPILPGGQTPAAAGSGGGGGVLGAVSSALGDAAVADSSQIVSDAMRYQGAGYVWGGAPANGIGNWDCSSFVNWVCGHDLSLPIPGYPAGAYTGSSHGPITGAWLLWGGLSTVGHDGSVAQPGDLCVWQTHMGIALGGGQYISAQDPQAGTGVGQINGAIPGELLFVRRY